MQTQWPDLHKPATQANLAKLLGLARSTIHGYHEAGVFTEGESLGVWLREYCNKQRLEAAGRANEDDDEMRVVTIAEKRAKTRNLELDAAQKEGKLVDKDDVHTMMQPAFLHLKTTLMAAGGRIASAITAQTGQPVDKRLIEAEIRTALSELSEYEPPDITEE